MTYSNFLSRALSGLFFMQLIFSGPLALAELSKDGRDHLIQQLTEEAKSTCAAPQKIHSHSADILDTAIRHRVDRTNGLLTSVFLELFILPNSSYVDMAFCMAIFLNIPMHHYWDSAFTNGKLLLAAEKEEANIPS